MQSDGESNTDQISELQKQGGYVGDFSDNVPEVEDRIFDVSLQLKKEQRQHVAGLLHLQVIHIGRPSKAPLEAVFHAFACLNGAFALVALPCLDDVNLSIQTVNDGIVGKRCSEDQ